MLNEVVQTEEKYDQKVSWICRSKEKAPEMENLRASEKGFAYLQNSLTI